MAAVATRLHPASGALSTPRNTAGRLPPVGAQLVSASPAPSESDAGAIVLLDAAANQRVNRALWSAAATGNASVVRKMLHAGASPDVASNGFPAVCVATVGGHVDTVALLCEAGVWPDAVVEAEGAACGATAMYLAAHGGHANIVRMLVEAGGNIETPLPENSCSPLYMAAEVGHVETVRALVAAGAELDKPNAGGASAACIAAKNGNQEALAVLAKAGANLDWAMDNGASPAHLAAMAGQTDALVTLHTLGADVERVTVVGGQEKTPISLAAQYGHTASIDALRSCLSVSHRIVMLQARIRGNRRRKELQKLEKLAIEEVTQEVAVAIEEKRRVEEEVRRVVFAQKIARGMIGRMRAAHRIEEKKQEEIAIVKIQGGRRGQLGRRKVARIRGEIDAARQEKIDVIADEIEVGLATEREAREAKLTSQLESYRAAREAQMEERRRRIDEDVDTAPRPLLPVHIDYEDAAACKIQSRVRGNNGRKRVAQLRAEVAEAEIARQLGASLMIGKFWRGWQIRDDMRARTEELAEFEAEQKIIAEEAKVALLDGDIELLRAKLPEIEDVDRVVVKDRKRSLLHLAAGKANLLAVEGLLAEGASAVIPDADGQTALSISEALVFFHRTRGARNAAAMENASRVFHLLELAVEPDEDQLRTGTAADGGTLGGSADELKYLRESLYGTGNVWQYNQSEANVDVNQYVEEVSRQNTTTGGGGGGSKGRARARTQALVGGASGSFTYQPSAEDRAKELGISMRLREEEQAEEAAIDACTSPLQASGLLASMMASAFSAAEGAEVGVGFDTTKFSGFDYDEEEMAKGHLVQRTATPPPTAAPAAASPRVPRKMATELEPEPEHSTGVAKQPAAAAPIPIIAAPLPPGLKPAGDNAALAAAVPIPPASSPPKSAEGRPILSRGRSYQETQGLTGTEPPADATAAAAADADADADAGLSAMNVKQLREHAASRGVGAHEIEHARDSDSPKATLIELIQLQAKGGPPGGATCTGPTREELNGLSVKDLRQKASALAVDAGAIEHARDSDDPRAALIDLIIMSKPPAQDP